MKKALFGAGVALFLLSQGMMVTDATGMWQKIPEEKPVNVREYTEDEAQILLRIATAEAESEHNEGMFKVMNVVLNRVESPNYPDTIAGVVFQQGAFSSVKNGRYDACEIRPQAHDALARLEKGEAYDTEIVAFQKNKGKDVLSKWYEFKYVVGCNRFYKEKGGT